MKFDIKFLVFAGDKDYRGHIKNEMIYSHMKIYSLKEMIKKRFDIASHMIYLFNDLQVNTSKSMDDGKTLQDYGFLGESDYNSVYDGNKKHVLYYDFSVGKPDPIVHCDYYFNKE